MNYRRYFRHAMMLTLATGLLASCSKDNNSGEPDSGINNNDLVEIVPTIAIANQNAVTLDGPQDGLDEELTLYFVRGEVGDRFNTYGEEIETIRAAGEDYQPLTFHPTQYYPVDGSNIKLWGWYPKATNYDPSSSLASWTFNGYQDIMFAQGKECNITTTDLKFELEHVLTQLQFIIYTESDLAAASWGKVTSIVLKNEYNTYELDLLMGDLGRDTGSINNNYTAPTFTLPGSLDIQKKTQEELEAMTEAERATYLFGTLMVAPKASTSKLTLYVTTENSNGEVEVDVTADASNTNAFKAGYATRVYLNFLPGEITATLKTGNWKTVTVDDVILGEYPYVQRGYIVISKDLLGESGAVLHENWTGATPAHIYTDETVNTVSASFEVAETDCEDGTTFTWGEAATKCSEIGPGWRVPTAAELLLMRDCKSQLETSGALSGAYWSATEVTTVGGDDAVAVDVDADDKIKEVQAAKNDPHKVRCVRDI